jgi:hypothetical protein
MEVRDERLQRLLGVAHEVYLHRVADAYQGCVYIDLDAPGLARLG